MANDNPAPDTPTPAGYPPPTTGTIPAPGSAAPAGAVGGSASERESGSGGGCAGGCLRFLALLIAAIVVAVAAAIGVLTLNDRGLIPWLSTSYRNRATLVLDSVQQMSMLTTTRYNFSTMVTSEREMPPVLQALYGERQVLVAVGAVTAGIDLSTMTMADVTIEGDTLRLALPPPAVLDCFLDESASYVADRATGVFAQSAPDLEGQAREYAIEQFRTGALDRGILNDVQEHAQAAVGQFIRLLRIPGIQTVEIIPTPPGELTLPPTCQ